MAKYTVKRLLYSALILFFVMFLIYVLMYNMPMGFIETKARELASRPGARRENVQNYIKRLEKLESIASSFEGVERSFAIQAGREVRIMVKPEVVSDEKMVLIARDIVKKIEDELEYPGQIKVNIIRESRVSDYAK